jgi:hypothetical protein
MPYTNIWSVVIPAGGVQAKLIDDHIRQLRLDLAERFEDVLFVDMDTDPIVLKDAVKGKKVDKKLIIGFAELAKNILGKEYVIDAFKMTAFTDSAVIIYPIKLPPGVTLKRMEIMNDRVDSGSVIFELRKRDFGAGFPTNDSVLVATVTNNGVAGVVVSAPADFAEVIGDDQIYFITMEATGTAGHSYNIFGIRLTYDAPDSLSTI